MNRNSILLVVAGLLIAASASAVTTLLISNIRGDSSSTSGSVAVTTPGSSSAAWAKVGTGLTINAGVISAAAPTLPTSVTGEIPAGAVNGTNAAFTLANTPAVGWPVLVYRNGVRMNVGNGDYAITGATITFSAAQLPQGGTPPDTVNVDYWH